MSKKKENNKNWYEYRSNKTKITDENNAINIFLVSFKYCLLIPIIACKTIITTTALIPLRNPKLIYSSK